MLALLGTIYYALAMVALVYGVYGLSNENYLYVMVGGAVALSSAFFGAMCFVANDIRSALFTMAQPTVSDSAAAPAAPAPAAPAGQAPVATLVDVAPAAPTAIEDVETPISLPPDPVDLPIENASEEELMAEYDIVQRAEHFLAYGRVQFDTLLKAIEYVKSTRR